MFRGLTQMGANYLATRLANALPVEFVKVKIGNGSIPSETNPYNSQNLISYMQDAKILSKRQEENAISITVQVTNENREQGFYLKEIGVFVNDNGIEKLYWYCNEDNAQYVPAKTDSGIAFEIEIKMEVTNQESTILNWSGEGTWINKTYLENTLLNYTEKGTFTGTAGDLENRITGLAGKQNGKFPLNSAIKGNVYLLEQTQKFYVCTQNYNGTTISVPNSYFTELSVYENMNRLENFLKTELLFDGKINSAGTILVNNVPDWVKILKIQSSNDEVYYFQDVFLDMDLFYNTKEVRIGLGAVNDCRIYAFSLVDRTLKISSATNIHSTATNNYIRKIYGLNY